MHVALLIPTDDGQPGRSIGRIKPQRTMRTVLAVVLDVDAQDALQVPSPYDQQPVQALGAGRAHPAFGGSA
jgi:hypothetical protein